MTTRSEPIGDILVVTLDNPPVNSLSLALRQAVLAAVQQAERDAGIRAVLLIGANGIFCGGADLRVLDTPQYWTYPRTIELAAVLDELAKPIVAAVGGLAFGGGLELAMGCHWRIASAEAKLALPEVKLGLLPGGGGTIRLPRLVGVETATAMMLAGETVTGRRALEIGLVDALAGDDLLQDALRFTRDLLARGTPPRRARDLRLDTASASWFAQQRHMLDADGAPGPARRTILDCIEAGVHLPMEQAVDVANAGTRALIASAESKALRHLFFAEREAGKGGAPAAGERRRIARVALVGGGAQADALAAPLRAAGCTLAEDATDLVVATRIQGPAQAQLQALHAALPAEVPFAAVGGFEAWQGLRALLPRRTVLGLHQAGRLVELAREPQADAAAVDALVRLLRRMGRVCVACTPVPGLVLEQVQAALARARRALQAQGHAPAAIDGALRGFGFGTPAAPTPDDAGLVRHCIAAMAAEGQRLLDSGVAVRDSDIDIALVAGGGFPAVRGGPMYSLARLQRQAAG